MVLLIGPVNVHYFIKRWHANPYIFLKSILAGINALAPIEALLELLVAEPPKRRPKAGISSKKKEP